uniref:Uncharacterized protein n=1 Tax=Timema monikensis TaxID=170555 RepID=A0A7R9EL66_9NEOP|nr:unnamed protein product [Timema monikensis]
MMWFTTQPSVKSSVMSMHQASLSVWPFSNYILTTLPIPGFY